MKTIKDLNKTEKIVLLNRVKQGRIKPSEIRPGTRIIESIADCWIFLAEKSINKNMDLNAIDLEMGDSDVNITEY